MANEILNSLDYMALIGYYHPTVVCVCIGDPYVYANITYVSGDAVPSKATLDADHDAYVAALPSLQRANAVFTVPNVLAFIAAHG
jgi:hypothetical protein